MIFSLIQDQKTNQPDSPSGDTSKHQYIKKYGKQVGRL
jgi:hypothetical protein